MRRMGELDLIRLIGRLKASFATFVFLAFLLLLVNHVDSSKSLTRHGNKVKHNVAQPVSVIKMPFPTKNKVRSNLTTKKAGSGAASRTFKLEGGFPCPTISSSNSSSSVKCRRRKKHHEKLRKSDITKVFKDKETSGRSSSINSYLKSFNIDHRQRSSSGSSSHSNINISSRLGSSHGLPPVPKSLLNVKRLTPENLKEIDKFIKDKRKVCKSKNFRGFSCKKLKFSTWLAKQFEKNTTKLNSWIEIVKRSDNDTEVTRRSMKDLTSIKPDYWPEKIVYRLVRAWGDPEDLFLFYKYKDYVKSRELKITLPYKVELKVAPRLGANELGESARSAAATAALRKDSVGAARIFWDPGFNLKLKLPFFRDELKVAVSTGPSFIAGIGVGIAILIVKSMFAPFLFGMKWLIYNVFFKESSPFELMKMFVLSHAPESWDPPIPPPSIDHYRPPPVHNHYDRHPPYHGRPFRGPPPPPPPRHHYPPFHGHGPPPFRGGFKNYGPPPPPPPPHHHYGAPTSPGPNYHELDYHAPPPFDMKYQYSDSTPLMQHAMDEGVNPTISQLEQLYRAQLLEEGLGLKRPTYKSLLEPDPTNSLDIGDTDAPAIMDMNNSMDMNLDPDHHDSQSYIPSTGLQAEVEHFDPFYSPLLSKIDSIFTHLGHNDEGCRERVVCSIYKFPVKYAPYSNLISAQLSKHQSELKRPVTPSPKILRYFRYMKAAKDGQGGENCLDLYPKCDSDTDAVSSLPMITTFHQLSELMTAEPSSPAISLAAAG